MRGPAVRKEHFSWFAMICTYVVKLFQNWDLEFIIHLLYFRLFLIFQSAEKNWILKNKTITFKI